MKITKITIGRLFNLGNYEHVRYELTAEIDSQIEYAILSEPDMRGSASHATRQLEAIIESLNPRPPGVPTLSEIQNDESRYEREFKMSASEFERFHGEVVGGPGAYFERVQADIEEKKRKLSEWKAKTEAARKAMDDLGGQAIYTDAKLNWEEA